MRWRPALFKADPIVSVSAISCTEKKQQKKNTTEDTSDLRDMINFLKYKSVLHER